MANSNQVGGFGFGQLVKDTPQFIKNARKALNFFAGGVVTFLPNIANMFHTTTDNLATIIGLIILGVNTLASFFGVPEDVNTSGK